MHQQQNHRAFAALKTGVPANTIANNDGTMNSPSSSSLLSSNSSSSSSSTLRAPIEHNTTTGRQTAIQDRNSATHFTNSSRITKKSHCHNIIKSLKPPKVYIIKRNIRTRTLTVPEQSLSECARHVREIISTYTRDWLVVDLFDNEHYDDNESLHRLSEYFSDSSDSSSDNTSSKSLIVYDDDVSSVSKTSSASLHRAASAPSTAGYNSISQISATKLRNNIKTHPSQPPPAPPITNNVPSATKYNNNTSSHTTDLPLLDDILHYDKNYGSKQKSKNSFKQHTRLFSFYKIENSNCDDDSLANIPVPRDYTGMQHHFCRLLVECIHLECSDAGTTPQDTVSGYATSDSLTSQSSSGTNQSNVSNMPNLSGYMAVYDLRARRKLTENCYLDLQNHTSLTRHRNACVIDIPNCSKGSTVLGEDLFLVIRLEKPLQGKQRNDNSTLPATNVEKTYLRYRTPYAWTAVHLADVFGSNHRSSSSMDSLDRNSSNQNTTNSLDSRFGLGEFEKFRKKWSGSGGQTDHLVTTTMVEHRGSLDRRISNTSSYVSYNDSAYKGIDAAATTERPLKHHRKQRRYSWSEEDLLCSTGATQSISDHSRRKRSSRHPSITDNAAIDFRPVTLTINGFFKQETDKLKDEDLYKLLHEFKCQTWSGNTADQGSSSTSGVSCSSGTSSLLSNATSSPGGIGILASKKLKNLNTTNHHGSSPTCIKLDISPFTITDSSLENLYTTDLLPIASRNHHSKKDTSSESSACIVRELLEFSSVSSTANGNSSIINIATPHYVYRNLLYVYPKELNLSSRTGSARNITVKVQLMCGEHQPEDAMHAIFNGDGGSGENGFATLFTNEAHTSVTYHQRWPSFYDEVKIKLPADIHGCKGDGIDKNGSKNYHLLFTFYHVSCSKGKDGDKDKKVGVGQLQSLETPVGYTWLPLLKDRALVEGEYNLPVALHPIDPILANYSYITADVALPGIEWLDNHKPHFVVHIKPVSSVHPGDTALNSFFSFCSLLEPLLKDCEAGGDKLPRRLAESNIESELKHRLTNITRTAIKPLVQYINVVLDKLFSLLVEPPRCMNSVDTMNIGTSVFHTLQQLIFIITKEQNGNEVLQSYIRYHFGCAILTNEEYNGERLENYFDLEKKYVDSSDGSSPLTDKEISSSFSDSVFKAYGTTFTKTTGGSRTNYASSINNSIQHDEWLLKRSKALNRLQALQQCIIEQWILCTDVRIAAATDSTFFFDALIKCMALGVTLYNDDNETNKIPGIARFTGQFLQDLRNLLINFYKYIAECIITSDKGNTYLERTRLLNNNIASFLRDLLLVFINDENGLNYVYALIGEYVITMTAKQKVVGNNKRSYSILSSLKLDFFKILSEHRYYVELNLLHNNLDSTVLTDICDEYRKNHYLSSLVIQEFVEVLRSPTNDSKVKEKATELIIRLLQKHDLKVNELKVTVAWLYVPILSIFIKDQALLGILLSDQDDLDNDNFESFDDDDEKPSRRSSRRTVSFEAISSSSISSVKAAMASTSSLLSEKAIQNILVSILWILRNIREEVVDNFNNEPLTQYLSALSTWHANNLLSLMNLCVERFRYKAYSSNNVNVNNKKKNNSSKLCKSLSLHCPATTSSVSSYASLPPVVNQNNQSLSSINSVSTVPSQSVDDVKSRLEDVILGRQGARNDLMERRKSAANTNTKVRWNKDLMHYGSNTIASSSSTSVNALRQLRYRSKSQKCSDVSSYELSTENLLANDVGYIVLDTLENIIQVSSRAKGVNTQLTVTATVPSTVRLAFKVLLRALKTYQYQSYPNNCTKDAPSIGALKKTFEIVRSTITQYPRLLFTNSDQGYEDDGDSGCDCESIDQTDSNKLLQKTCLAVLCHFYLQGEKCNCNEDSILMQASATFYWLMRVNYNLDNNFPRVKMYGALALSTLLEKKGSEDLWYCNFIDNQRYRGIKLALQAVMKYADNIDSSSSNGATMLSTKFADQVRGTVDGMLKVIESINKIYKLMKRKTNVGDSSLVMNPSLLISSEDSQLLLEFMYSVACGYQQASACLMPQLRLRWLQRMASIHVKNGNYCEAAMCHINGTALLCEYLKRSDNGHYNLSVCKGAACLESISPNVLIEECAVSEELFEDSNDLYEMCEETLLEKPLDGDSSSCYSLLDLITIELQKSADLLWKASMYEKMAKVYNNLLIPLIERGYGGDVKEDISRYGRLAETYGKLREAYIMLDKKQKKSKPNSETFYDGTYFRVGIYYNGIGDIETSSGESEDENNDLEFSGKQYIYKEPQLTKLSEIFDRLQSHYSDKYGAENVIAVKHSNRISGESIDHKKKVYIQITYVEPCSEPSLKLALHSIQSSSTNDNSDNIKRFVYSTPFTLDDDGRTHACQLRDQYKRKTLLTTERHFPYILTRIPVFEGNANIVNNRGTNTTPSRRPVEQNYGDHMEVIVMQPIEVAIEDLQRKTQELARSINQTPADAKMLQMVLQGCIGTTVNCGPMEMATVFLSQQQNTNSHNNLLMSRHQNKLRLCFKDFSRKCADALEKNRGLIGPDQRRYQQELERNYTRFSEQLAPLLLNSNKNGIE
ncbi:dedicator of cytokinesis protein 6 [Adelges cooleyi]|uniref:dedicator of cytokinesis protein 6 n=1 Tax=Adelges cooleyi TaxID=133065 RepID=UPI00217FA0F2|nr:dedicator of cytokinesis protein 6 [Adelges cooleyi]XP_050440321.1 dedicator of cytokinesis protein 6 [Adelges cooleyi]